LQPLEDVPHPEVADGVPGYTSPNGRGYPALRNGSVVFVRPPREQTGSNSGYVPQDGSTNLPSVAISGVTTPVKVESSGLTQPGPPGPVWSWKQVKRTYPPTSMLSILAQASSSTLISNSFERLHVWGIETKKTIAQDADLAYSAHLAQPNPCPRRAKKLKKAFKRANEAVHEALNAPSTDANPYPSVDPPFKEYYVDSFEESPPPGPSDEGSEVGDNPCDLDRLD
jgi:hypothetical protein